MKPVQVNAVHLKPFHLKRLHVQNLWKVFGNPAEKV
jgi:hypothetical protein